MIKFFRTRFRIVSHFGLFYVEYRPWFYPWYESINSSFDTVEDARRYISYRKYKVVEYVD